MGDVYVEHRAVFIGGWGPSYTSLNSFYTGCQTANKVSGICRKCVTVHLQVICVCMKTEAAVLNQLNDINHIEQK